MLTGMDPTEDTMQMMIAILDIVDGIDLPDQVAPLALIGAGIMVPSRVDVATAERLAAVIESPRLTG